MGLKSGRFHQNADYVKKNEGDFLLQSRRLIRSFQIKNILKTFVLLIISALSVNVL